MTEHTPTPWNCASRYSSVVGVPIVNQQGKRIGNTALPDMPPEWDHMKRQAEIDAAFIVKAVNNHDAMVLLLHQAKAYLVIDQLSPAEHKFEVEKRMKYRDHIVEQISAALAGVVGGSPEKQR
jgi:hypothetical protein